MRKFRLEYVELHAQTMQPVPEVCDAVGNRQLLWVVKTILGGTRVFNSIRRCPTRLRLGRVCVVMRALWCQRNTKRAILCTFSCARRLKVILERKKVRLKFLRGSILDVIYYLVYENNSVGCLLGFAHSDQRLIFIESV